MTDELKQIANQPPTKTPAGYSINQIELLQTLGNFTFAAQYERESHSIVIETQQHKNQTTPHALAR